MATQEERNLLVRLAFQALVQKFARLGTDEATKSVRNQIAAESYRLADAVIAVEKDHRPPRPNYKKLTEQLQTQAAKDSAV